MLMERPEWLPGDYWRYKATFTERGSKKTLTQERRVIGQENGFYVAVSGTNFRFYYNNALNSVLTKTPEGKPFETFDPEMPTFRWPLKVGKWWAARYSWNSASRSLDDPPYVDVTVKVVGTEYIQILGKEVLTFKLLHRRYNPRGICICEIVQWVSPQFKNTVKWTDDRQPAGKYSTGDLVAFTSGD